MNPPPPSPAGADRGAPVGPDRTGRPTRMQIAVRVVASLALLALVGTYVAAQVDLVRRHQPGIAPARYWAPQLAQIWLPGLAAAAVLGAAAYVLARAARPK